MATENVEALLTASEADALWRTVQERSKRWKRRHPEAVSAAHKLLSAYVAGGWTLVR